MSDIAWPSGTAYNVADALRLLKRSTFARCFKRNQRALIAQLVAMAVDAVEGKTGVSKLTELDVVWSYSDRAMAWRYEKWCIVRLGFCVKISADVWLKRKAGAKVLGELALCLIKRHKRYATLKILLAMAGENPIQEHRESCIVAPSLVWKAIQKKLDKQERRRYNAVGEG